MSGPANLAADAFAGTALAYARFRPPYPRGLLDDLLGRVAGRERLLDLACGPGRVALDLAGSFDSVWAIDLEPEMVAVGQADAVRRGIGNVTWFTGRAEDLAAPGAAFDLITIGEAFHRLDQGVVAGLAMRCLKPGGCLATMGTEGLLNGRAPWQRTVAEVARRWMAKAFPQGWGSAREGAAEGQAAVETLLRAAGFAEVVSFEVTQPHAWSFEAIVGYLESTSVCSRKALGDDFPAFEADLRDALPATGPFHEDLRAGYTLARKPRQAASSAGRAG